MYCPKCETTALITPTHLLQNNDPHPMTCPRCGGVWLAARDQRDWDHLLYYTHDMRRPIGPDPAVADTRTGLCPEGHRILIRARVDLAPPFYLERCSECRGIWFDAGELTRLLENRLLDNLPDFWSFQRQIERRRNESIDADNSKMGDTLKRPLQRALNAVPHFSPTSERKLGQINTLAHNLANHPHRNQALSHMQNMLKKER